MSRLDFLFNSTPEIRRAQWRGLNTSAVLIYFIIAVNTLTLDALYWSFAPLELLIVPTLIFVGLSTYRSFVWLRYRHVDLPDERISGVLRVVTLIAGFLGVGYSSWAIALIPYGTEAHQGHLIVFVTLTALAMSYLIVIVPTAAFVALASVMIPMIMFLALQPSVVSQALAGNLVVIGSMIVVAQILLFRQFYNAVVSRQEILDKHEELMRLSDENQRLANEDSLTGLPNRRRFFSYLQRSDIPPEGMMIGILDLDGFKQINDVYGHTIGDRLLVEVSRRMRENFSEALLIARLGGDEFGIICGGKRSSEEVLAGANKALASICGTIKLGDIDLRPSASVGFARLKPEHQSAVTALEHADIALYNAKQSARGDIVVYSADLETSTRERFVIEQKLREADLENELFVVLQPIIDTRTAQVASFEVLGRWKNPVLGMVPPNLFIVAAERASISARVTDVLFAKALRAMAELPETTRISFNLSAHDVTSADAALHLSRLAANAGIAAGRITFEITETSLMGDFDAGQAALNTLRREGFKISLDDFGTGFSSLSYVRHLPLDTIKIDRSFVTGIEHDDIKMRKIMKAVIDLCGELGVSCVVEGVETAEQLQAVTSLGAELIQGYYFAAPMPVHKLGTYLASLDEGYARATAASAS